MAIDALVKPLLSLPIFRGLKPIQLTEIVRRAERVIYAPSQVILAENQVSEAATIIVSGSCIRLDDNKDRAKGELLPEGTMLAELAMLVEIVNSSTVVAQSRVKALRLTRTQMRELMEEDRALIEHFSSQLVGRLQALAEELGAVDQELARAYTMPASYPAQQMQQAITSAPH